MSIIKLIDANGKEFEIDVKNSISSIKDDLSLECNAPFISNDQENVEQVPTQLSIVNADGTEFTITDSENDLSQIVSIDAYIEASHSNTVINNCKYTDNSMLRDVQSYTFPFAKPMLKHHNDFNGEPIGRIKNAECIDSNLLPGTKAINVVANITDKDAMTKLLDGRYNTVSIGAYPKSITCNHCGNKILKDGKFNFCGHMRGQVYDNQKCTWTMEDLEYSELSIVNAPADRYAQVYKLVVNKKKNKEDNSDDGLKVDNNIVDEVLEAITEIENLVENNEIISENNEENVIEGNNDNNQNEIEDTENEVLKEKIKNLELQLSANLESINNLTEQNTLLSADNEFLTNRCEELSNKLETISDSYKKDLLTVLNKFSNNVEENANFKIIKSEFDRIEYNNIEIVQQPTHAINPGLVNNKDEKNVIIDSITETVTVSKTPKTGVINIYSY